MSELKRNKKILQILFAAFLSVGIMTGIMGAEQNFMNVQAASKQCEVYYGSNVEDQNYEYFWATPIESYLVPVAENRLMRVQANAVQDAYLVEYYDAAYQFQEMKLIPQELELFGGFYATDTNYYILSGQTNEAESADVECFRITKYDKDWNRISGVGLYDCNTTIPFRAGSARFAECGKYLLIRTSHEMYADENGVNHQANVTIQVDSEKMEITSSFTRVLNRNYGYISHSFNQFIHVEDNKIIALDHGDALPRSIVLIKYTTDVSQGNFVPDYWSPCKLIEIQKFQGATGYNATGATIGGFEISDSAYLTAYNSIDQENGTLSDVTKNVYVAACDKATSEVTVRQITNFPEGETTTSTPHFVKISDTSFVLFWSRENTVYYTKIDGAGNQVGDIYEIPDAHLSDCVPTIVDQKLVWYVWNQNVNTFYEIDLTDFSRYAVIENVNGHELEILEYPSEGSTLCKRQCKNCEYKDEIVVPSNYQVWWNESDGNGNYQSWFNMRKEAGDVLYFWVYSFTGGFDNTEMTLQVSETEPGMVAVDFDEESNRGSFTFLKDGVATFTFALKYNPAVQKTYTFVVGDQILVEMPEKTENVVDCGIYKTENGQTAWTLTKDGVLIIRGNDYPDFHDGTPWEAYKDQILSMDLQVRKLTASQFVYEELPVIESIKISVDDTSDLTDLSNYFYKFESLKNVSFEKLDTSHVTDMSGMFAECTSIESIDLSKLDLSAVNDMDQFLFGCLKLKKIETPLNCSCIVELPKENPDDVWCLPDGSEIETLPQNADRSVTLAKTEKTYPLVTDVFFDVKDAWYTSYVQYVYDRGLMGGNNGMFNPGNNVTRAQLVTILYRLAGEPEVTDYSACDNLSDISRDKYYTDAVCWAYNEGITTGKNGMFDTTGNLTRQQMAAFLFRFADTRGYSTDEKADYSSMLNADKVSAYSVEAVSWAVGSGMISGSKQTDANGITVYDLNPQGNTSRAQMAAILQRFCEYYGL